MEQKKHIGIYPSLPSAKDAMGQFDSRGTIRPWTSLSTRLSFAPYPA